MIGDVLELQDNIEATSMIQKTIAALEKVQYISNIHR